MGLFDWLMTKLPAPNRGPRGEAFVTVLAQHFDDAITRAKHAATVDLPSEAPDDALPNIGHDRATPRMPGENPDTYRARLANAFGTWGWACTSIGMMAPLMLGGLGAATIYSNAELPRPPFRTPPLWARLTIVFSGRVTWDADFVWDSDFLWDARAVAPVETWDADKARSWIRGLEHPVISARDRITLAIIARGATLWDAGMTWDTAETWDTATVTELGAIAWDSPVSQWDLGDAQIGDLSNPGACWDYLL